MTGTEFLTCLQCCQTTTSVRYHSHYPSKWSVMDLTCHRAILKGFGFWEQEAQALSPVLFGVNLTAQSKQHQRLTCGHCAPPDPHPSLLFHSENFQKAFPLSHGELRDAFCFRLLQIVVESFANVRHFHQFGHDMIWVLLIKFYFSWLALLESNSSDCFNVKRYCANILGLYCPMTTRGTSDCSQPV